MSNKIKNTLPIIGVLSLGFIFSIALFVQGVSVLNTDVALVPVVSTTTPQTLRLAGGTYGVSNASTTFDTNGVDMVDLNIQFKGSSTDAVLNWTYEFSDNFIDWYGEDLSTAATISIAHSSTTVNHTWQPQTSSVVRKNIGITDISSRYMRIVFFATNATSSIHARVALKKDFSR